ncbi:MAG TPA: ABC transporter permease [Bryobacteraceae bacterium]|nr:ABC transporter permease [Bryobacteraceae bacterium]
MSGFRRLLNVFRSSRLSREFDEELAFHREMRMRRAKERGLSTNDADLEVNHRMGNLSVAKEEMRDARVSQWLSSALQDLRHGAVLLRRDAGVSGLIILVLALGIGGNAAIFTLLKAAFVDPLPYPNSERLVTINDGFSTLAVDGVSPTIPEFLDIRKRTRLLAEMAFLDHRDYQLTGASEPVRVFAARVTASFFSVLDTHTALGRTFYTDENQPAKSHVVIVSDAFWRGRMGSDPGVIGKTLRLNDDPTVVVGVMPPGFSFDYPGLGVPERVEVYVPFQMDDYYTLRSGEFSNVRRVITLARLAPGATIAAANGELESIANSLLRDYPELYRTRAGKDIGFTIGAQSLRESIVGKQRQLLILLLSSVGLLLMIACANTAQLLLARSLGRSREVAIRVSLGASRPRLIRQFLLEGLVLAAFGGLSGLLLSVWLVRLLAGLFPEHSPIFDTARPDALVIAFTLALSFFSALLFAIVPAVKGSVWTPGPALSARVAMGQGNRWRHVMIAIEAALSVFLLSGAGLLVQNLWKLVSMPAGFDLSHLSVMQLRLPFRREEATRPIASLAYREYLDKITAIPGVDAAAAVTGLPLRGAPRTGFRFEGQPDDPGLVRRQVASFQIVSPDYFRTLGISLMAGRTFRDDDMVGRPDVVIVNEEFVRRFGDGRDLIGRRIASRRSTTIVGVVANVRMSGRETAPVPQIYASYLQMYEPNIYLVVRSRLAPDQLIGRVKEAIRSAYADQAVFHVLTMEEVLSNSLAEPRFHAFLIGAFALLALAMAASGMYSVISCLVSQRTSEIAIRIALGAGLTAIVRTVVGRTGAWLLGGLGIGLVLGLVASGTVRRLSHTAVSGSPEMYGAVVLFFIVVTLIASYLPVRRASRLDPAMALRCE